MGEKPNNSAAQLRRLNAENQRIVKVNVGVLKAAIREINAGVSVSGKGPLTDMTLNALNAVIDGGK